VTVEVGGSGPARTLVERAAGAADLVLVARHGRGGVHRAAEVPVGSVPERLLGELECPMLVVPATPAEAA
jgi:nucleotide-binding universal stress UspA family protein